MPLYIVEDLQSEEQILTDLDCDDINEALDYVEGTFRDMGFPGDRMSIEEVDKYHGYIRINMPYGGHYDYEVGEDGK